MNDTEKRLTPIPVDFVVEQGLKERTEAKRRPYRTLITAWAEHEGKAEQGETVASRLNTGNEVERLKALQDLPNSISPKFRKGEKAEQLVMIIREINDKVENDENWTWALGCRAGRQYTSRLHIFLRNLPSSLRNDWCYTVCCDSVATHFQAPRTHCS